MLRYNLLLRKCNVLTFHWFLGKSTRSRMHVILISDFEPIIRGKSKHFWDWFLSQVASRRKKVPLLPTVTLHSLIFLSWWHNTPTVQPFSLTKVNTVHKAHRPVYWEGYETGELGGYIRRVLRPMLYHFVTDDTPQTDGLKIGTSFAGSHGSRCCTHIKSH